MYLSTKGRKGTCRRRKSHMLSSKTTRERRDAVTDSTVILEE